MRCDGLGQPAVMHGFGFVATAASSDAVHPNLYLLREERSSHELLHCHQITKTLIPEALVVPGRGAAKQAAPAGGQGYAPLALAWSTHRPRQQL